MTEEEHVVLQRYSTPGLRKSELSRSAKRDNLRAKGVSPADAAELLDKLYPETVEKP